MIDLPKLPYTTDSLEPYISQVTVQTHYGKHTKTYYENTNKAIKDTPQFRDVTSIDSLVRQLSPSQKGTALYNNACQAWNHTFYWNCLTDDLSDRQIGNTPLYAAIKTTFGSLVEFKKQFADAAEAVFGSGWVWLVLCGNKLSIETTADGDTPFMSTDKIPLLACDVWEHAYYLDVKNDRKRYVYTNFFAVVNWEFVNGNYDSHI
jgi:Fe-Mn family superoxide dismutase